MSDFIKAGVIGHPIGHSKSPLIHQYWIAHYGLEGSYEAIDIPCENLKGGIEDLVAQNYAGFNVTLPHKEDVMALCDEVDEIARAVGAVNTVNIRDGKLHGTNTDVFGFVENIKQHAPDFDFTARKFVVLGAGGAARAVVQGLTQEDAPEIHIVNRTRAKAEALVSESADPERLQIHDWGQRSEALGDAKLLVNTTNLGMDGQAPLEIDLWALSTDALVCDIVYAPLETALLAQALERGNKVVNGIGMLLHQARPAFAQWFGTLPEVDAALEEKILA